MGAKRLGGKPRVSPTQWLLRRGLYDPPNSTNLVASFMQCTIGKDWSAM